MTQLELDAQKAAQLIEGRKRQFIEQRLLTAQWCASLVQHYNNATSDVREKLPPLPGTTPEQMLPSLFADDSGTFDVERYTQEAAVLRNIQAEMNKLFLSFSEEAMRCKSELTPQS